MQIHIARDSSSLGVFTLEEVIAGLKSGKFLMTDLAWREGMSTWVMLAQWREFAGVISAVPPDVIAQSNNLSVTVPWEKAPTFGNFFLTIKGAIVAPYSTFASGSFNFKQYIPFAYLAALILVPFSIFGQLNTEEINHNLVEILISLNNPFFAEAIHNLSSQPPTPPLYAWLGVICYTIFCPFFIAIFAGFLWLALRLFRETVSFGQTAVALIVSLSALNLCSGVIILTSPFKIYFVLAALFMIPSIVISCRCTAAILKVSPLKVFGAWVLWGVVGCCCCCGLGALGGFIAGYR
jgi:hypothetical protein